MEGLLSALAHSDIQNLYKRIRDLEIITTELRTEINNLKGELEDNASSKKLLNR